MSRGAAWLALTAAIATSAPACTSLRRADAGLDGASPIDAAVDARVPDADAPPMDVPLPGDGGVDAFDARACVPSCVGGSLRPCEGAEPVACPLGCVAGPPARCTEMRVTNVADDEALPLLPATTAATGTIDSTMCRWTAGSTTPLGTVVTMDGGGEACVFRFESLTIAATSNVRAVGFLPVIVISEGPLTLLGELSADSTRSGSMLMGAGDGTGGSSGMAGMRGSMASSGGGGGGFGTAGGAGGDTVFGSTSGGAGGLAIAMPTLEPLVGGGVGGAGGTSGMSGPRGGRAGGALQLSSHTRVVIEGYLGAAGSGGERATTSTSGGGGGGSGGGLLIEAPMIVLGAGARLNVTGGGGGTGACTIGTPEDGQDGAEQPGAPAGGSPCSIGSGAGGDGAGDDRAATAGMDGGGGGGGGAGVVRFRSLTPPVLTGVLLNPTLAAGVYRMDELVTR